MYLILKETKKMVTQKVRLSADELIELLEDYTQNIYEDGKEAYIDGVRMVDYATVEFSIKKD